MPARFARRLRRKIFLIFVAIFLSFGSRFLVIFLQFWLISGTKFSYLVFSYRVSGVYMFPDLGDIWVSRPDARGHLPGEGDGFVGSCSRPGSRDRRQGRRRP